MGLGYEYETEHPFDDDDDDAAFEADEKVRIAALHKSAPEVIWLQVDPEAEQFDGWEAQTWCSDKINETDVKYIRADLTPNDRGVGPDAALCGRSHTTDGLCRSPQEQYLKGKTMIEKKTWKEFQDAKLLWWINRLLHTFGWAIVLEVETDGEITAVYPARVTFRGFDEKSESEGFIGLTEHIETTIKQLVVECHD